MVNDDLKKTEEILNSTKGEFIKLIVNNTISTTRAIAQKTKEEKSLQRMIDAANYLAQASLDIPPIHIDGSGAAPVAEPSVKITYPNLMNRIFYEKTTVSGAITLLFETKNVKKPYNCYIYARDMTGHTTDLIVERYIRFDNHKIPDIQRNRVLKPGRYEINIIIYENTPNGKTAKLKDSKGKEVVDKVIVDIRPSVATGTVTPGMPGVTPELTEGERKQKEKVKGEIEDAKIVSSNPEIHITNKGDFGKEFQGSDNVPLIFEVKNIQKYTVSIFLQKDANNAVELNTRLYDKPIIKLALPIRDILRQKYPVLNLSDYKSLLVMLRDENRNQLSGGKLMDSVNISIAPLAVSQFSKSSVPITILKPLDSGSIINVGPGGSIPSNGPIELEFQTDLPTPFSFTVNFPSAGGLVHAEESNTTHVKTSFKPQSIYETYNKPIALKKGVNKKLEVHIYYPAKSNIVVATKTIFVNII